MIGYKAFNNDLTCRDMKYEIGKEYKMDEKPISCERGYHFCKAIADCYVYYDMSDSTRICKIEAIGDIETDDNIKYCTNHIRILEEVTEEHMRKANVTSSSSGYCNSGYCNSGNWNSGNRNSGNWNSGYCNSGYCNSGNKNSGDCNSGDRNSGDWNSGSNNNGNYNSGNYNSGSYNSGVYNSGNYNSGLYNSGERNTGSYNSGNDNSGFCNSGDRNSNSYNSGNFNSGRWNSGSYNNGDYNSGHYNSGNKNSGDYNSGDNNSGDWNSGFWNSGCSNSGVFNTDTEPTIKMFDKPSNWTMEDWLCSKARRILKYCPCSCSIWVLDYEMTEKERNEHPEYKTIGGYIKTYIATTEEKQKWWDELSENDKEAIKALPNFDADKFCECVGIEHI